MTCRSRRSVHPLTEMWDVHRIETIDALASIEPEWRQLEIDAKQPSLFCTYDYIRIAWDNLRKPDDVLHILTIRNRDQLIAIAPLRASSTSHRGIRARSIDWIAILEGERPGLLCCDDPTLCWKRIEHYFANEYRRWDLLKLPERINLIDAGGDLFRSSWVESTTDSIGYYIDLSGDFEAYVKSLDTKVKSNWRNRSRKISALTPPPETHRFDKPEQMEQAINRFIAIERKSWKADAKLGMGKDKRHRHFYAQLLDQLATRGEALFYFLSTGNRDIAGSLMLAHGDIIYERHIAHDPDFSALSPGIVLRAEILKEIFGGRWHTLDLMGMPPAIGRQRHKADWATGHWESTAQYCYRKFGRLTPLIIARKIRDRLYSRFSTNTAANNLTTSTGSS